MIRYLLRRVFGWLRPRRVLNVFVCDRVRAWYRFDARDDRLVEISFTATDETGLMKLTAEQARQLHDSLSSAMKLLDRFTREGPGT